MKKKAHGFSGRQWQLAGDRWDKWISLDKFLVPLKREREEKEEKENETEYKRKMKIHKEPPSCPRTNS